MRLFASCVAAAALSGCAVTSFAPPVVNLDKKLAYTGTQSTFYAVCSPKPSVQPIHSDVDGALGLISNYVLTYRCQRDRASEGRQFFEVPSMLATIGGATAAAFGAAPAVAIATGATSAALGAGKTYWAPKDKAQVFNNGLSAILCVQNVAVGVDPSTLKIVSNAQRDNTDAEPAAVEMVDGKRVPKSDAQIEIPYDRQYFEMIRSALFSIEQVVAQRLSAAGTPFDAAGVIAEIEKLTAQQVEEKKASGEQSATKTGDEVKAAAATKNLYGLTSSQKSLQELSSAKVGATVIKIDELQTKLDKCVVSAKI